MKALGRARLRMLQSVMKVLAGLGRLRSSNAATVCHCQPMPEASYGRTYIQSFHVANVRSVHRICADYVQ